MGRLIDSSILIAAERGQLDLARALADHSDETFCISAVTASELLHGVERLGAKKRAATQAFVEGILRAVPILPFDLTVARAHARVWAELRAKGRSVGERDLMIAATAIAHGLVVVTRDERSFPHVPGISVERW